MGQCIKYIGFHPYSHQGAVINELRDSRGTGKVVCCKSSRQKGKSYMIANLLLYFAINFPKTKNFCVTPTLKQAKAIYKTIVDAIAIPGSLLVKSKNATDLIITLTNGSSINFKSAEQREALRGYTADFLCIDEAAFIPDDVFYLILPWTDAKKAPMLLTSSPFVKNGFFWDYFNFGLEGSHNTVTVDWSNPAFKPSIDLILPPEKLEQYRLILPSNVFKSEYLGEFLDDEGMVFNDILYVDKPLIFPGDKLYFGIDWSNQTNNDDTVLTAFNERGEQVFLKYWNNLTPLGQIDVIYKELELYRKQIEVIVCETNSIGTPYTDLLKAKSQWTAQKVDGFTTSNTSKNELVVNTQVAIERQQIRLLADEKLKRQFGYFSADYNPKTRNVTYAAPQGLHDDIVLATMFAHNGFKTKGTRGAYVVSALPSNAPGKIRHNKWNYDHS